MKPHRREVAAGQRFEFGKNWAAFLRSLSDERIETAERSLGDMLETSRLDGKSFLDVGSGSGLFSLAARRLGARVHSFDYDPESVACTLELKRRYFPEDPDWVVEEGSVLDREYLRDLGRFDVVYSWGVLHHTGAMWQALENVAPVVAAGGKLFIAIYNDQGKASRRWKSVKQLYNRCPQPLRFLVVAPVFLYLWKGELVRDLLRLRPLASLRSYRKRRGMSAIRDAVDWAGGYPFEVAKPEEIFDFYRAHGFTLARLKSCGGSLGCNQFVFERPAAPPAAGDGGDSSSRNQSSSTSRLHSQ